MPFLQRRTTRGYLRVELCGLVLERKKEEN
jgi:hypothetical protein